MTHHPDCDHWRIAHPTETRQISREGRGMWQASCGDCDWTSIVVGPDGGLASLKREEEAHGNTWTQCVGECLSW